MAVPAANLSKVNAALATGAGRRSKQLAFLVLPGSFSPVHSQHLSALEIAREVMANLGWHVIGGFLAPSDDDYVRRKVGNDSWPFARRLELCRLATDDSPWVDVAPWAEFSSYRVTTRLRQVIESNCCEELQRRSAIGVEVMGSDSLIRILGKLLQEWESPKCDGTAVVL
jgi:nicotinic acid mononucleotide adenylyltransferase